MRISTLYYNIVDYIFVNNNNNNALREYIISWHLRGK